MLNSGLIKEIALQNSTIMRALSDTVHAAAAALVEQFEGYGNVHANVFGALRLWHSLSSTTMCGRDFF